MDSNRESNWSQVRETVLMLELAALQIEAAMRESNSSVEVLMSSFTSMANHVSKVSAAVQALPQGETKTDLLSFTDHVGGMLQQSVIAMQFYDRLTQRLTHVGGGLESLSQLVGDQDRLFNPEEWAGLQDSIRSHYTTREEVAMFDAVVGGTPVRDAIDNFVADMKHKGDDIEFF